VTLNEGRTPLIPAPRLSQWIAKTTGVDNLTIYLKYEGLNPTGSFKDRGMTWAMTQAKCAKAQFVICASTGNTSASAAAYAARAELETLILIPKGKVAMGKLAQALMYGAKIVEIDGNFDQALDVVRVIGDRYGDRVAVVNSINPYRIEGQRSGAFEVCDDLGCSPDALFIPVGNAGNITGYWHGFKAYHAAGRIQHLPRMMGYQAAGAAPLVLGYPVEHPETLATAIRIGKPASWDMAMASRDESGGKIDKVTDMEILQAYGQLGRLEGVFCEPASAASVAGVLKAATQQDIASGQTVVCVLTGNGLKDPDTAIRFSQGDSRLCDDFEKMTAKPEMQCIQLPPDVDAIARYFGLL
jgi:threonine synthase